MVDEPWRVRWARAQHLKVVPQTEVQRIIHLPTAGKVTEDKLQELSRLYVQGHAYEGQCDCSTCNGQPFRLLTDQANGLHQFLETGRGFWSIAVGGGKTGLSMLVASIYHSVNPEAKILLLMPPSVYGQFLYQALPWGRKHLAITVPWFGLGNKTKQHRLSMAKCGLPGCYVLPYSCLSTADTIEVLEGIGASLVIADEAQNLKGDSAKTKRFWSYVDKHKPAGVAMSGTLTSRTPMEYFRLIRWCMGEFSPLPVKKVEATDWSNGLRSGGRMTDTLLDTVRPLIRWAGETPDQAGFRRAYQSRMHSCPSFYTSGEKKLGVSLEIHNIPAPEPSKELADMISLVERRWEHPSGDFLSYGIELHSVLRELNAGFYYRRYWDESHPMVEQAKEHWEAGQHYHSALRGFFSSTQRPREGMDTPMLVGKYHHDHGPMPCAMGPLLYQLWSEWKALYREDLPERLSEPVFVDDFKIRHAVEWAARLAKKKTGAILWVIHQAVADWLMRELHKAGVDALHKGAGANWLRNDGSQNRIVVASIDAHGTGKNLQDFQHQLVVQWPRSATQAEQLIGRTHRTGQQADRLVVHTNLTTDWDHEQMACTLGDTAYVAETMGRKPKLLVADWDPLPKTFPQDFLRVKGWDV